MKKSKRIDPIEAPLVIPTDTTDKPITTITLPSCPKCGKLLTSDAHLCFSHEELLETLYFFFDAFERSSITFLVAYTTLDQILKDLPLIGDKIELVVRKLEWQSGSKDLFMTYLQDEGLHVTETEDQATCVFRNGVKVVIYLLDDSDTITSPDTILYKNEYFKFPNPYDKFLEIYGNLNSH